MAEKLHRRRFDPFVLLLYGSDDDVFVLVPPEGFYKRKFRPLARYKPRSAHHFFFRNAGNLGISAELGPSSCSPAACTLPPSSASSDTDVSFGAIVCVVGTRQSDLLQASLPLLPLRRCGRNVPSHCRRTLSSCLLRSAVNFHANP